jgi:hypothetical protein
VTLKIVDNAEEQYQAYTAQTSTITRSLAITAVAIVWLFGGGLLPKDASPEVLLERVQRSNGLKWALLLALAALVLDLLQYAWGSVAWGRVHRCLDAVLEGDDGRVPVGTYDAAWVRARKMGLVEQLERVADLTPQVPWDARREAVRAAVHPPGGGARSPALERFLDRPAAPRAVTVVTAVLFGVKLLALAAAYACLAVFLL